MGRMVEPYFRPRFGNTNPKCLSLKQVPKSPSPQVPKCRIARPARADSAVIRSENTTSVQTESPQDCVMSRRNK
eukprot:1048138-Prorocentrum_minimum.AAC.1